MWRVTCPNGAYVRQGLYLGTKLVAIVPFGGLVEVEDKTINAQGLSRLRIRYTKDDGELVLGWCSEFLNPVSGQRGPILRPLPLVVPALFKVSLEDGAVIRDGVELSSPFLGRARMGSTLRVVARSFSEHPADRCLQRLQLAGRGGYISLRLNRAPPEDVHVVEAAVGDGIDPTFDPFRPEMYHLEWIRRVRRAKRESSRRLTGFAPASEAVAVAAAAASESSSRLSPNVSSIDEDEENESSGGGDKEEGVNEGDVKTPLGPAPELPGTSAPAQGTAESVVAAVDEREENIFQALIDMYTADPSAGEGSDPTSAIAAAANSAARGIPLERHERCRPPPISRDSGQPPQGTCLICHSDGRTATIVHGETGHVCCCLLCARILKARCDPCPVCRLPIDLVVQHFWA
jgi:hypothetical protein